MIVTGRHEMDPEASPGAMEQLRLRYRLAAMTADAYFDAGFTVVVQDTIVGALLPEFLELFRGRPLLLVVLSPRPVAIKARENARRKTGYSEWSVERLDRVLRTETLRLGLWIDSSEQTPEQTVEEILHRAWDEAVVR
jgi:hypothetical protein